LREQADGRTNARLAPTVAAMRVNNPDRLPLRIDGCGFFERISFFENFVPQIPDKQVSPASSNKHARQEKENQKSGQSL
jgi:hypothetical protein